MKLILLSKTKYDENEMDLVKIMFESGLETYHLRKPRISTRQMKLVLEKIPSHFHNRIVIHSHHQLAAKYDLKGIHYSKSHFAPNLKNWWRKWYLKIKKPNITTSRSFSSLAKFYAQKELSHYDYLLLYPIFDALTGNFQNGYHTEGIISAIKKTPGKLIARGGVDIKKIEQINNLGFSGMVLNSCIWKAKDPLIAFHQFLGKCRELNIEIE